jgi:TRAP-type C4-dicarboxylate transport system substrate-binding protein
MWRMRRVLAVGLLAALPLMTNAHADPRVLRLATAAPDGTAWAREVNAFAREVETQSAGQLKVKIYFGGIAGDELNVGARVERGQLDGTLATVFCERVMPAMRVTAVPGLFQERDEATYVLVQLLPLLEQQAHAAGYTLFGTTGIGPSVIFSRTPVRTLADLRALRLWVWDLDIALAPYRQMKLQVTPTELTAAAPAFDSGQVDAFLANAATALAFQWSARARFVTDLRIRYLSGCLLVADRAFGRLSYTDQQLLRGAAAKLGKRFEETGREQEKLLLGGLFERQGLKSVPVSESLRSELFSAAREIRDKIDPSLVDPSLLARVQTLLSDYRAEHRGR